MQFPLAWRRLCRMPDVVTVDVEHRACSRCYWERSVSFWVMANVGVCFTRLWLMGSNVEWTTCEAAIRTGYGGVAFWASEEWEGTHGSAGHRIALLDNSCQHSTFWT